MFVTSGQFGIFALCFTFGSVWGFAAALLSPLWQEKNAALRFAAEGSFFLAAALAFFWFRAAAGFPSARLYMLFGVLAGMLAVCKSIEKTVAKYWRKVYNRRKEKRRRKNGSVQI